MDNVRIHRQQAQRERGEHIYFAASESRPGVRHARHLDPPACSCIGFRRVGRCWHLSSLIAEAHVDSTGGKGQLGHHRLYRLPKTRKVAEYVIVTERGSGRTESRYTNQQLARSAWGWLVGDSLEGARLDMRRVA